MIAATTAALACSVVSVLPASANASTVATGPVSATIVLRTPDEAAIDALARFGPLSITDRQSELAALMPTGATRTSVRASLAGLGLTVDHTTSWTMTVHGSAAAVAALQASGTTHAGFVTDAPSLVPGAESVVSGGPTRLMQPLALRQLNGANFRAAYGASSAKPHGPNAPVIATMQLAGWNPRDLSTYAGWAHLPKPGAHTFTAVSVDGAKPTAVSADSLEVALDQESIYSVDPYAHQRAYFAPNNGGGILDALAQVATDAYSHSSIMALSISWGSCEYNHYTAYLDLAHAMFSRLTAAGVTVFAASGDSGSDDCHDGQSSKEVDYPASDPMVVGVGGTTLDVDKHTETAWGAYNKGVFHGTGGGVSAYFARPSYQNGVVSSGGRGVPDIAADADPNSGAGVIFKGAKYQMGGTSLSAPLSAALLTAELGSRGIVNGGLGDIHRALYTAPSSSFRDITSGYNGGYAAGSHYDFTTGLGAPNWHALVDRFLRAPVVTAPARTRSRVIHLSVKPAGGQHFVKWRTGYGNAPACGTIVGKSAALPAVKVPADGNVTVWVEGYLGYQRCLVGRAHVFVDSHGPAIALTARANSATSATYAWKVSDSGSGVTKVVATVLRNGKKVWGATVGVTGQVTLPRRLGSVYQLLVGARDGLGNTHNVTKVLSAPYDDKSLTFSPGWSRILSKPAFQGSLMKSVKTGATARIKAYGSHFALLTTTCANCGIVAVWVDGKHVRDVSLYSAISHPVSRIALAGFSSYKIRSIVLKVTGTKAARSSGKAVHVDGLVAS